jgi:hypothetical protein
LDIPYLRSPCLIFLYEVDLAPPLNRFAAPLLTASSKGSVVWHLC